MIWDDLFEAMLKEIAKELGFGFSKTRAGYLLEIAKELGFGFSKTRAGYLLAKGDILLGFSSFVDRDGRLKILVSPRASGRPIDLGNYPMDELKGKNSKARKNILAYIIKVSRQ